MSKSPGMGIGEEYFKLNQEKQGETLVLR